MSLLSHHRVYWGPLSGLFIVGLLSATVNCADTDSTGYVRAAVFKQAVSCDGETDCAQSGDESDVWRIERPAYVTLRESPNGPGPDVYVFAFYDGPGYAFTLQLEADLDEQVSWVELTERDSAGAETFRSTQATGLVQFHRPWCACSDGRFNLVLNNPRERMDKRQDRRVLRGRFSLRPEFCLEPLDLEQRELSNLDVQLLECPESRVLEGADRTYERSNEVVVFHDPYGGSPYHDVDMYSDVEPAYGCGGEEPLPDPLPDDDRGGCETPPPDDNMAAQGCESDESNLGGGDGCEGDSSSSGDCEGDAYAAVRSAKHATSSHRRVARLPTLLWVWIGLAVIRITWRRRSQPGRRKSRRRSR